MLNFRTPAPSTLPATQPAKLTAVSLAAVFALALSIAAAAQQPDPQAGQPAAPAQSAQSNSSATQQTANGKSSKEKTSEAAADETQSGGITEEELKQMLVGKTFYLRGGYLDDSLAFNERGALTGHSPQGSYALSLVEIDRVQLSKHKVELEGLRYGLHFLGALPYEDPATAVDKVCITPRKKIVKISIDRELVVKPKKEKEARPQKNSAAKPSTSPASPTPGSSVPEPVSDASSQPPANPAPADASPAPAAPPAAPTGQETASTTEAVPVTEAAAAPEPTDEAEAKAEMAAAPAAERPADPASITTTFSAAHATQVLKDALDKVFAPGMDDRLKASLPDFWKFYYQAAAQKTDYRPADPAVQRQSDVDKKARLLSTFEPQSNQYAQDNGVAGMALYHTVIGPDGKPGEIAVARPIGFGLDENAVEAIRNAKFEPAIKDGKPVPVLLDLVVQFRIYSNRTKATDAPEASDKSAELAQPSRPGPYSIHQQQ